MIHFQSQRTPIVRSRIQGGSGDILFDPLFTAAELGERAELTAVLTLQPGDSIGAHAHTGNGEIYFILSGEATVTEDGEAAVLHAGDCEFCADGHTHSIANHSQSPMSFLAVILPNR